VIAKRKGCCSEAWSEGSVEQKRGPMNKNWMGGLRGRASEPMIAKPISIKDPGGKSSGRARKAVELITGDLPWLS
jgi:hypothetical protein